MHRVYFWGAVAASAAFMLADAGVARADADLAAGKTLFGKCGICHSVKAGENKIGPSLAGIVGRASHSAENYTYSAAMKAYDVTWDEATLDKYLIDPRAAVPNTKMIFPGLKVEAERQNLIAYLATLK